MIAAYSLYAWGEFCRVECCSFAIASGVVFLLAPHDHVETRVTVVPVHGGGAISYGGSF